MSHSSTLGSTSPARAVQTMKPAPTENWEGETMQRIWAVVLSVWAMLVIVAVLAGRIIRPCR